MSYVLKDPEGNDRLPWHDADPDEAYELGWQQGYDYALAQYGLKESDKNRKYKDGYVAGYADAKQEYPGELKASMAMHEDARLLAVEYHRQLTMIRGLIVELTANAESNSHVRFANLSDIKNVLGME